MKHILLAVLMVGMRAMLNGQSLDCSKFHDGTFSFKAGGETFIIKRKGNTQIETSDKQKGKVFFIVDWTDDCTYTLTITKKSLKDNPTWPKDLILIVTIIEVKENSYVEETTSNIGYLNLKAEIFKIK